MEFNDITLAHLAGLIERAPIPHHKFQQLPYTIQTTLKSAGVKIQKPGVRLRAGTLVRNGSSTYVLCFVSSKEMLLIDPVYGTRWSDVRLPVDRDQDHTVSLSDVIRSIGPVEILERFPNGHVMAPLIELTVLEGAGEFVKYDQEYVQEHEQD